MTVDPNHVHHSLSKHMLVDGFDFVIDLDKSSGNRFHDAKSGKNFLDFFSCFASMPLGWNRLIMLEKQSELGRIAINNIAKLRSLHQGDGLGGGCYHKSNHARTHE